MYAKHFIAFFFCFFHSKICKIELLNSTFVYGYDKFNSHVKNLTCLYSADRFLNTNRVKTLKNTLTKKRNEKVERYGSSDCYPI